MPTFYASGMIVEPGFATTGYSLFWLFNRLELLCAAISLTGVLALRYRCHPWNRPGAGTVLLAALLIAIALIDTYGLTPQMSALGAQLDLFNPASAPPVAMNQLHAGYWILEVLKLSTVGSLIWMYTRPAAPVSQS